MKVNIVGRHVHVTPAMQDYARDRLEKLDHFFVGIRHVDVTMNVHGLAHHVEVAAFLGKKTKLVAKADGEDMYKAIDVAEAKLEKQIRRLHARLKAHRDRSRIADGGEEGGDDQEATYEQVVREMLEDEDGE